MSKELIEKDLQYVWHPYTALRGSAAPVFTESAEGAYLHAPGGRKILDAVSSWWVNIHGHSNAYIADAIAAQAKKLDHVIFAGFTHEKAITLAERLLQILPGNPLKFFYSDNGSTAVEVAMKLAIQYWHNQGIGKRKIIALEGAYHGDTFGAMAAGERGPFNKAFWNYLFDVAFIPFPEEGKEEAAVRAFEQLAAREDVAAFIYEPLVQGAGGMRIYSPEILDRLLEIASRHGIVCIADEVMTGFGRTGKLFASEYMQHKPDIMCLSKGITGGFLPLGATTCTERIVRAFDTEEKLKTFFHGHSYTANPIICAAACASLDLLLKQECLAAISRIEKSHREAAARLEKIPSVGKVRVLGTILSLEIATTEKTSYFHSLRDHLYERFLEKDLLIRPLGNVIYILPPYIIQKEELQRIYDAFEEVLKTL